MAFQWNNSHREEATRITLTIYKKSGKHRSRRSEVGGLKTEVGGPKSEVESTMIRDFLLQTSDFGLQTPILQLIHSGSKCALYFL
jgi:hypothetical protein